jgi:hypothetical protein
VVGGQAVVVAVMVMVLAVVLKGLVVEFLMVVAKKMKSR